jgi:hypothetical protein
MEPGGGIERIPTRFLIAMVGRVMVAMASPDRTTALARFNRWVDGNVDLTPAQVELLEVSMGAYRQRLPRPDRLDDDQLRPSPHPPC